MKERFDLLTKGALIGGLLLGGSAVYQHEQEQSKKIESLIDENKRLHLRADKNDVGDCLNEAVLREAMGLAPSTAEVCRNEREDWYERREELLGGEVK